MTGADPGRYSKTSFLSILLYVLGFMAALALLAYATAWLLRHVS